MTRLQLQGWKIGLRFDPISRETNCRKNYARLFHDIFTAIDTDTLHSVTLGGFLLPGDYFSNMLKLYPDERLFASVLENTPGTTADHKGMITCHSGIESEMLGYCNSMLSAFVPQEKIHYSHAMSA